LQHQELGAPRVPDRDRAIVSQRFSVDLPDGRELSGTKIRLRTRAFVRWEGIGERTKARLPDPALDARSPRKRGLDDTGQGAPYLLVDLSLPRSTPAGAEECVAVHDLAAGAGHELLRLGDLDCCRLAIELEQKKARRTGRGEEQEPERKQPTAERTHESL
jgi:hypothetical protein